MIVDPSDIVGRNRRQENSNAMVSEGEEVNMGMVGIDSIHVEPEWCFWCGFSTALWKKSRSSRQTRTQTVLVPVHLKNVCVCVHAVW